MRNIRDSFLCQTKMSCAQSWSPVHDTDKEIIKDYNLLFTGISSKDAPDEVKSAFELIEGCHLTSKLTEEDSRPGCLFIELNDEDGTHEVGAEEATFGVYLRNNLPLWVVNMAIDIMSSFAAVDGKFTGTVSAIVTSGEEFDAWLSDDPRIEAFTQDVLVAILDNQKLQEYVHFISPTWEIKEDICICFYIRSINKEEVILSPIGGTIRVLPFEYKATIENFKHEIVNGNMILHAVAR